MCLKHSDVRQNKSEAKLDFNRPNVFMYWQTFWLYECVWQHGLLLCHDVRLLSHIHPEHLFNLFNYWMTVFLCDLKTSHFYILEFTACPTSITRCTLLWHYIQIYRLVFPTAKQIKESDIQEDWLFCEITIIKTVVKH